MKKTLLIAAAMTIMLSAAAQPTGSQKQRSREQFQPKELTVEEEAQHRVDRMSQELPLTQKQVKKLLKFYKKDIQYRRNNFQEGNGQRPDFNGERPQGMQQGNRPEGMPQGGERPSQGMRPDGSQGGFPGGGPGMGPQGSRPQMKGDDVDIEKFEKYNQKQEKKLKKILGDNLYEQWRSKHSKEALQMPEPKLR